jgi:hypothetical protein
MCGIDLYDGAEKRQCEMEKMEQVMKSDQFYFTRKGMNSSEVDNHRGNIEIVDHKSNHYNARYADPLNYTTNRSKTSDQRSINQTFQFNKSNDSKFSHKAKLNNSSRENNKKNGYLTGISTYAYEIMELPVKKSFMNSIRRNQHAKTESLRRMWDKVHTNQSSHLKRSPVKNGKLTNPAHKISNMGVKQDKSIFDHLPAQIRPKVTNSVDLKKSRPLTEYSVDFTKNSKNFFKPIPKDNISIELGHRIAKIRKRSNEPSKLAKNTRRDIAQRIYSKLQNWPAYETSQIKPFKKFYWTKDYSH